MMWIFYTCIIIYISTFPQRWWMWVVEHHHHHHLGHCQPCCMICILIANNIFFFAISLIYFVIIVIYTNDCVVKCSKYINYLMYILTWVSTGWLQHHPCGPSYDPKPYCLIKVMGLSVGQNFPSVCSLTVRVSQTLLC